MARPLAGFLATAALVAGCNESGDIYDARWRVMHSSPTSSTAVVLAYHGYCDFLSSVRTISTSTIVTFKIAWEKGPDSCNYGYNATYLRVRLGAVLGDRKIVDACQPAADHHCAPGRVPDEPASNEIPVYGP